MLYQNSEKTKQMAVYEDLNRAAEVARLRAEVRKETGARVAAEAARDRALQTVAALERDLARMNSTPPNWFETRKSGSGARLDATPAPANARVVRSNPVFY